MNRENFCDLSRLILSTVQCQAEGFGNQDPSSLTFPQPQSPCSCINNDQTRLVSSANDTTLKIMSSKPLDVLIAGGGIAGLSAAIGFRRAGHRVRILERSHFSDEVGAAITIPPNAVRVLQAWGMDFPKARMINFEGMEVVAGEDEEPRRLHYYDFSASEETFGSPYLLSHRVDLHEALRDIATTEDGDGSPAEIINGSTVVAFDAEAGTVRLAGSELSADLVVAADGIRSTASKFIGYYSPAVPSSTTVIRFLIPTHVIEADPGTKALVAGDGICSIYTMTSRNRWLVRYPCREYVKRSDLNVTS